ncbi:DUF5777 family beta-barrel protein [Puia dinghuensis]|uniref:DUF5777 domain-containing protein n=1 Tax=Puia dinghuensis TaxID=1792502 RepID=A0A8J2XUW4_9BACT|nr:DUF5777 family beta-barrel protein [Puia dinghuensis]GGB12664.1 hypothetical protein GCM10011511_40380 [Puia dinghuensis]
MKILSVQLKRRVIIGLGLLILVTRLPAQDNLLKVLDDSLKTGAGHSHVTGTFKATRIVNLQTVEAPARGDLNFTIQHRFGQLNSGSYNFFGLDNATLRLGLDYGLSDRLAIGVGRSTVDKTFDGNVKYKLLRQTDGSERMPVTVAGFGSVSYYTIRSPDKTYLDATYRTAYVGQLLIARKFNRIFSAEIVPSYLHYNLVPSAVDKNDEFAVSAGGRIKITHRMSLNVEYNYLLPNQVQSEKVYNSFSAGWDIETGGHVFQLIVTNSQGLIESQYLGRTMGNWGDGGIYFGFNISRNFNLVKRTVRKSVY